MKKNLSKSISMKKALIELYLSIKKYYNNNTHQGDLEYLFKLDEMTLIKYINRYIHIKISRKKGQ